MTKKQINQGQILISDPFMQDDYFKRTVVALCDYSKNDGAVGFILNKPTHLSMQDVLFDFPEFEGLIYYGGPVSNETIYYLHCKGEIIDNSREIAKGLYWGGDFSTIKFLIKTEVITPKDIKFYIGYSGWSPGQIEDEIETNSWIVDELSANHVFSKYPTELWQQTMHIKGNNFSVLADMADSVSLN
jgi:putative transcriptional regulator